MFAKPLTMNESMMYSTVRIHGQLETGEDVSGTSFFLSHTTDAGPKVQMLVSNRHVVGALRKATLHLHRPRVVTEQGRVVPTGSIPLDIEHFDEQWIPHPDPDVDLCALPYEVIYSATQSTGSEAYEMFFESSRVIPPDRVLSIVDAAEEVQLIGYPAGMCDGNDSFPLFRRGTLASHPRVDYRQRPEVLLDIAAADGCSGAPVLVVSRTRFRDYEAENWPVILFGVLSSGFGRSPDGIVRDDLVFRSGKHKPSPSTMHLCAIIKARELPVLAEAVAAKLLAR